MTRPIQARLARLEAASCPEMWREWEERPADDWPDEALEDFLRASISARGGHAPATFTDEHLTAIAAEREALPGESLEHPST